MSAVRGMPKGFEPFGRAIDETWFLELGARWVSLPGDLYKHVGGERTFLFAIG
jgi:hypothetical protein